MNSCYNPVCISPSLPLLALSFSITPSPSFSPSFPLYLSSHQSPCYPALSFIFVFSTLLLSFHFLTTLPPPHRMFLSLSSAEVQSQGFCLLVIYFVISPLSEVHALGLSMCCGEGGGLRPRATQIKKTQRVEERRAPWTD